MSLLPWGTVRSDQAILTTGVWRLKARTTAGSAASEGDGRENLAVPIPFGSTTAILIEGSKVILPGLALGSGAARGLKVSIPPYRGAWGGDF
jgi:hypothetical protein